MHTDEQSNIAKIVERMKQKAKGSQDPACECATCILYRRCRSNKANAYGGQNHIIDVSANGSYFVYLVVDSTKANYGITRALLAKYKKDLAAIF